MRRIPIAGILLAVTLAVLALPACTRKTDEAKIRGVIEAVRKAAEERDVKGVLAHMDKQYRDAEGNDYQAIKGMLLYYFFRHQKISVIVTNMTIAVDRASASARFQAILSGRTGASGDILPEALGAYRFEASFRKEQDDWKILSARWERWGEAGQDQDRSMQ